MGTKEVNESSRLLDLAGQAGANEPRTVEAIEAPLRWEESERFNPTTHRLKGNGLFHGVCSPPLGVVTDRGRKIMHAIPQPMENYQDTLSGFSSGEG